MMCGETHGRQHNLGADAACAVAAVKALRAGIDKFNANPTIAVAWNIVKIVKRAPYDEVKPAESRPKLQKRR